MLKKLKTKSEGFTIIEVMIVLAIAALILLIVLLAVPALQRSSRNTQRKNDVAAVLSAVSNYISNNNGQLPQSAGVGSNSQYLICGANCKSGNTESAKLGYYQDTSGIITVTSTPPSKWPDTNHIVILTGYTCDSTSGTLPQKSDQQARTAVALYEIEGGSNGVNECTEQ